MKVPHCQFYLLESFFQISSDIDSASQQASSPITPADSAGSSTKTTSFDLLVSNLNYSVTRPQLISIFEFFGRVDMITLHRDYQVIIRL